MVSRRPKHGGKREGAGRKPRAVALVALTLKIEPKLLASWNARKDALGISGPALLAKFLGWKKGKQTVNTKRAKSPNTVSDELI